MSTPPADPAAAPDAVTAGASDAGAAVDPRCRDCTGASISLIIEGRPRPVGSMTVARLVPSPKRRSIGPFVFLDRMGPVDVPPGVGFDVPPHPHIGLSTVTYLVQGENIHRDSLGTVQRNCGRDLNLMTAGRGVVHSERADAEWRRTGGRLDGVQLWLALPTANEEDAPSFQHAPAAELPSVLPAPGVRGQVLLGRFLDASSPVRHPSAPLLCDLELGAGASLVLDAVPAGEGPHERAVFVLSGEVIAGEHVLTPDHLAVLVPTQPLCLLARTASRVLLVGGPPLDGPRYIDWNFVSSSPARIAAARAAWQERRFPLVPGDEEEFVPLPPLPKTPYRFGRI
ncbi:MAG: pirin family protein [Polyangia bacterium]